MRIVQRFEKGQKFLDLIKHQAKSLDEDGCPQYDECWECCIWENEDNPQDHKIVEFASEFLARLYIQSNNWAEQVL